MHKGGALPPATTVAEARMGWKVDVSLEAHRGNTDRTMATLLLRDDLSKLADGNGNGNGNGNISNSQQFINIDNRTIVMGEKTQVDFKKNQTVGDLRTAAAEARGLPFERTIIRYRNANGKELINDAATLERKKVYAINDVSIEVGSGG